MTTDKLRVGMIGCGGIARAHAKAYRAVATGVEFVAWDPVAAAAAKFAADCVPATAVASLDAVLAAKPDVVSICSPPVAHLPNSAPFLAAGIPVLCEKPLAIDAVQARELAALVARSGTVFMVAFCHRFHGPIVELKKLLAAGTLGEPVFFRNIFGGYHKLAGGHRADPAQSGGGVMIDNGAHAVDLFRFLAGEPTHVQAMIANVGQDVPVEDTMMMHLNAGGRCLGELASSMSFKVGASWVEVYGTKGTAWVSYWNAGQPDLCYRVEGSKERQTVDCSAHPDRFAAELRHFLDCARAGRTPAVSAADGVRAAEVLTAAYQSAREGRRIAV